MSYELFFYLFNYFSTSLFFLLLPAFVLLASTVASHSCTFCSLFNPPELRKGRPPSPNPAYQIFIINLYILTNESDAKIKIHFDLSSPLGDRGLMSCFFRFMSSSGNSSFMLFSTFIMFTLHYYLICISHFG